MFYPPRLVLIALMLGMLTAGGGCRQDRPPPPPPAAPDFNGPLSTTPPATEPSHDAPPRSPDY